MQWGPEMRETHTPIRSVRVPDDLWAMVKERAATEGTTVTQVIVRALRWYIAR